MVKTTPGCCGKIEDQVTLVKKVSESLVVGHMGLASIYLRLAHTLPPEGVKGTREEAAFLEAASKQKALADASRTITVPDASKEHGRAETPLQAPQNHPF